PFAIARRASHARGLLSVAVSLTRSGVVMSLTRSDVAAYLTRSARRAGPVAGVASRPAGSVTHSPDSPLFERRTGLGGPTPLGRPGGHPGATRPSAVHVATLIRQPSLPTGHARP